MQALLDRGLTLAAMDLQEEAVIALRKAVAAQPDLTRGWEALARLLPAFGARDEAKLAQAKATQASAAQSSAAQANAAQSNAGAGGKPPPARPVATGKREQAERKLREMVAAAAPRPGDVVLTEYLLRKPDDACALRLLAQLRMAAHQPKRAEDLLLRAIELAPDYLAARRELVNALLERGRAAEALPHIDYLLSISPNDETSLRMRASVLGSIGEDRAALAIYDTLLKSRAPKDAAFWLNYALHLHYTGRREDCVRAYRRCIELHPTRGEAYWGIANLKYEKLSPADIDTILHHLAHSAMTPTDRFHFHYTLGHAYEKARDYEASFRHYEAGAALRSAELEREGEAYSADRRTDRVAAIKALMTPAFFAARRGWGHASPAPIFVLGMPRSGSTLVEQILSSHSMIEGTQELPEIVHIAVDLGAANFATQRFPRVLAEMDAQEFASLGARFLDNTRIYRKTGRPYYIDKLPFNWVHTGLIHLMFPNAKIIDTRREPMSCCFSVFKQLIARGAEFAYTQTDLGRFYNDYADLMAHFDQMLPGRVHRVVYEQMVDNTEHEIRRLLAYCGVPFEETCLRFWETERAVATPSSEQVRKPIFRDALEQWRNYEPWLGPLKATLGVG